MSLKNEILELLCTPKYYHKGAHLNALLLPAFGEYKPKSIKNNFYDLHKRGYIEKSKNNFIINNKGKNFLKNNKKLKEFSGEINTKPKDLLLLYDIPEDKKREREWFRRTLIKFSFKMIQRSVWVGPSPLPKEFLEYIKSIGLKDSIKTFKLAKGYNIK